MLSYLANNMQEIIRGDQTDLFIDLQTFKSGNDIEKGWMMCGENNINKNIFHQLPQNFPDLIL